MSVRLVRIKVCEECHVWSITIAGNIDDIAWYVTGRNGFGCRGRWREFTSVLSSKLPESVR